MRNKLLLIALLLAALLLFWSTNHGAYRNYFQADSLDNIGLAHAIGWDSILKPLAVPVVPVDNFRPVGIAFLKVMSNTAGLRFPPYIAALQILHLINAFLVFLLLRKLGLSMLPAATGVLFFAFHMALFTVLWEPMYVFDLLCGFFCLLSLLTYIDGHWIASFFLFWLAYRSKENAIMLPLVLAAWEFRFGPRKWARLAPFFALSLVLGVQALSHNTTRNSAYTLHFDPASIWKCISYYSSQLLLIPFASFAILLALFFRRNQRLLFGFLGFCALLAPMLLLPGRLFSAYLYVPLIAVAICIAALSEYQPKVAIATVLLLWVPWNYVNMRWLRNTEMARADKARVYVDAVAQVARENPKVENFLYHGIPMEWWAISGTAGFIRGGGDIQVRAINNPDALKFMQSQKPVAIFDWQPPLPLVTLVRTPQTPDVSYIKMDRRTPVWQLTSGWNLDNNGPYRWIAPSATARLARPTDAKQFELSVNVVPGYLKYEPHIHLRVLLDGHPIGERDFDSETIGPIRWDLDQAPAGPVTVSFEVTPGFRTDPDGDVMGISLGSFGFIPQ